MASVGRPLKFKSVEELQEKIDKYFIKCKEEYKHPTILGLALALNVDRDTLLNYEKKEEYFGTIKRAKDIVEEHLEQNLYGSSVTGVIFNLKNNFGWKDKTEVDNNLNGKLEIGMSEEIKELSK